jgi:hypothetical protein
MQDTAVSNLEVLRSRFLWPNISDLNGHLPYLWSLDGGGREIVTDLIKRVQPRLMLEVGTFLGGSALRWLEANPDLTLIVMDTWHDGAAQWIDTCIAERPSWLPDVEPLRPISEVLKQYGFEAVALHNLRQYRNRVIPVKMQCRDGYANVREYVKPDIIYIDADKQPEDYLLAHELFPQARLCGDDWTWQDPNGSYPVREYVARIAGLRNCAILVKDATWVLEPRY